MAELPRRRARHLVVAAHVGDVQLRAQYEQALEGCALQIALLTAPPDLLRERLVKRPRDQSHWNFYAKDGAIRQEVLERVAADQARLQATRVHDLPSSTRLDQHKRRPESSSLLAG